MAGVERGFSPTITLFSDIFSLILSSKYDRLADDSNSREMVKTASRKSVYWSGIETW